MEDSNKKTVKTRHSIIVSALILALLPGCALIFGGRTNSLLRSATPHSRISAASMGEDGYSDYVNIGTDSITYKLKNMRDYTIRQELDGYKTQYTPLLQTRYNYFRLLGYALALGFDALFISSANAGWDDETAMGVGIPSFFMGVGGWWLFPYGPKKMYEKHYDLPPLTLLPKKKDYEKNLFIDQAAIDIQEHGIQRDYYNSYKDYKKGIKFFTKNFGDKMDYENSIFAKDLNKLLVKYEYCDTTKKLLANTFNSLRLRTTITGIKTTIAGNMSFLELTTTWSLHDYFDKSEKVTRDITSRSNWISSSLPSDKDFKDLMEDALENALISFLADEEVKKNLKSGMKEYYETTSKWDTTFIATAETLTTITDAVKAVVIIKNKDGHGSGCLISEEGWIITNYHVSGDSLSKVEVLFEDGTKDSATVVRINPLYDLALLKVKPVKIKPFKISDAKVSDVGTTVYAIGTPTDIELGQTVSKGIISGKRKVEDKIYIQTDVSINSGSSGGALINENGVLIGIVNAKIVGFGVEGIGFAIPANYIREALKVGYKK